MLDSLWNMCKAVEVGLSELPTQEPNIGCVGLSLAMWVETYRDHEPAAARSLLLRDLHSLTAAAVDVFTLWKVCSVLVNVCSRVRTGIAYIEVCLQRLSQSAVRAMLLCSANGS